MKMNNSIMRGQEKEQTFSVAIRSDAVQSLMRSALANEDVVKDLTATLISLVAKPENEKLRKCKPDSIVAAALQGATMGLSLALQHYSVVPYQDSANFQISYRGLNALAMDTKMYEKLGVREVLEGEFVGADPLTGESMMKWITDPSERAKRPIVGYYAYYRLKDGFSNSLYWSHDEILDHADTYAPAFSRKKYEDLIAGKISQSDGGLGSPWYGMPNSTGHKKMCKKTVLKQLLSDGIAPVSTKLAKALHYDDLQTKGGEVIFSDDTRIASANADEIIADVKVVEKEPATVQTESTDEKSNRIPSYGSGDGQQLDIFTPGA